MYFLCALDGAKARWVEVSITEPCGYVLRETLDTQRAYRFASHVDALRAASELGLTSLRFRIVHILGSL